MTTAKINIVETVAATTAAYTALTNADTAPVNITDINGNPTGWTIRWSTGFAPNAGGVGYNGVGAGDALWADEADVLVKSVFHNSFSSNAHSEIIIEGPEQLTISAVGSYQQSTSHPDTEIWVNGGAVQTMLTYDSVNARGNNTDTADFIDVLKDVNNQFVIRFRHKTGERGYINGLQLVGQAGPTVSITGTLQPGAAMSGSYSGWTGIPSVLSLTDSAGNTISSATEITDLVITDNGDGTGSFTFTMPALPSTGSINSLLFGNLMAELT